MGNYKIDAKAIQDLLIDQPFDELLKAIESESEELERLKAAQHYFSVVRSGAENVVIEKTNNAHLGHCTLKILIDEDLPKKVCFLRNGMLITDSLQRLKRFTNFKGFVAIFECENSAGNKLLREMEPPRHDDFQPEILVDKAEQVKAKKALQSITTWIKDMLSRHAMDPVTEETQIDELSSYVGVESDGDGDDSQELNPTGKIKITPKKIKRKPSPVPKPDDGENGTQGGSGNEGSDGGGGDGGGAGAGSGGKGTKGGKSLKSIELRNVRLLSAGGDKTVNFTPSKTCRLQISLLLAGADSDFPTSVLSSDRGEIRDGKVILDVETGERVKLKLSITETSNYSIKVVANEV